MKKRIERRKKLIRWGNLAIEIEVDAVFTPDESDTPYYELKTVKMLDEIAHNAELGDIAFLKKVGKVYELVEK